MGALSPLQGIGPDDLKIKGLLARVGDGVNEVDPRDQPERRRRGDRHLPGAAAQAARRPGDPHRDGRAGRQRSRIRRRSDDAQGARRASRGLAIAASDAAVRLRAFPLRSRSSSAARCRASPATGCSGSCWRFTGSSSARCWRARWSASTSTGAMVGAAIVGGIAGALILMLAYFVGIALVGAGLGALVAHARVAVVRHRRSAGAGRDPARASPARSAAMLLQRYVIIVGDVVRRGVDAAGRIVRADRRPPRRARRRDRRRLDSLSHVVTGTTLGPDRLACDRCDRNGRATRNYRTEQSCSSVRLQPDWRR